MRDLALLRFTLRAMRAFGGDRARWQNGGRGASGWHAGAQPLNGQAVQDLVADGWLRQSRAGNEVWIDAWPAFASSMCPFADMSSGHLSAKTSAWLDQQLAGGQLRHPIAEYAAQIAGGTTRYGWLLYVPEDEPEGLPADHPVILAAARRNRAEYVLFDSDATPDATLPVLHPHFQD